MSELLAAAEAMRLLGVQSRQTLSRIRRQFPEVAVMVPGMHHPRYRRRVLMRIVAGSALDASAADNEGARGIRSTGDGARKERA